MDSLSSDEDIENDDLDWRAELQANRLLIINHVEYKKLSPALQSAMIIDREDDEQLQNPYHNPTSSARANSMVNLILRKGKHNYTEFLRVLGSYYPTIFTEITKSDPPPTVRESVYVDDSSNEVLSFIFAKLSEKKQECVDLLRDNRSLQKELKDSADIIVNLKKQLEDLSKRDERYQLLENEIDDYKQVAENFKSENYKVCMRLLQANDDNSRLRDENISLRRDIDQKIHSLRQLENSIHSERSNSIRLRQKLDTSPTEKKVLELQKQIGDLRLRVVHAHETENLNGKDIDAKVDILKHDLRNMTENYEESNREMAKLREELEKTQELRIKYHEESDLYKRQCTALNDDCLMYKERRDAVWEQLQQVEKERDQLMKERNEAQLTAQTYMEEKSKHRYDLRQWEEKYDSLAQQLKQKEALMMELKSQLDGNKKDTSGLDLIQGLPSNDLERRHSNCDSVVSYDSVTGDSRRRKIGERRQRFPSSAVGSTDNRFGEKKRSLSDEMRDTIFHKIVETDGAIHKAGISGKSLRETVGFAGGNETGIFISKVASGSYADVIGLTPGMKILKIEMGVNTLREVRFLNCTLENAYNLINEIEESVKVSVQYLEAEYRQVLDREKDGTRSGDSFYVRANFSLKNKEGYLNFEKGSVLHVVNTRCSNSRDWHAYIVDLYTGEHTGKIGRIPSYRYFVSSGQFTRQSQSQGKSPQYLQRLFNTMPGSQEFCTTSNSNGFHFVGKASPYTVVKKAPIEKTEYRPCSFVPSSLSTVLCFKLTTMTAPHEFDFPVPKSVKCGEQEAHRRVVSTEAISCNKIGTDMYEFITIDAVRSIMQKGKHCILAYNEKCTSLETFNMMLQLKEIYPIVFHISAEKEKSVRILLDPDDKDNDYQQVFQQTKRDQALLDKFVPQYATICVDKCNRLEDVVQQVMDQVAQESNKIIWISGKSDVQI